MSATILQFPLLEPVREREPTGWDDLMRMPMPRLVDMTLHRDRAEAGKAIAAFHARLPSCGIGWDDLTEAQQQRWSQLVRAAG